MSRNLDFSSNRPISSTSASWKAEASDVLTTVIDALRLRGRVFCRSELRAPWGMVLPPSDYAHFHVVVRGSAWLRLQGRDQAGVRERDQELAPLALAGGDLVVVPHGAGHTLSDSLVTPTRPLADFAAADSHAGGCRVIRGDGDGPETQLVCGSFRFERRDAHPLLELLPALIHLRPSDGTTSEWLDATLRLLAWETREARPGTEAIVSRLTDVLFVQALRVWVDSLAGDEGGWLGALRDRQIGAALALIHRRPEQPWTIESLAAAVGMSRSRFAARFSTLVGEPPLTYLTRWRLEQGAQWLLSGEHSIATVAAAVGYESEAAFGKAFRRRFGIPPGSWRRQAAAA